MVAEVSADPPSGVTEFKELMEPMPEDCTLSASLLELFRWARGHYLAAPGEVLRTFYPAALLKGNFTKGEGARTQVTKPTFSKTEPVTLNPEQAKAVSEIRSRLGTFYPCLLQGVTGSGKTEVYLKLCEEILEQGKGGVLILVPEIALTPQMMDSFAKRFGAEVGSYHSNMTDVQRLQTWWAAKEGRQRIFVGTRSAVSLPVKDLSLIVIDEEHDSSYKQEERFRYHGRDLAVMRAKLEQIPVVLGTATPAMETQENVHNKKYHRLLLPGRATEKGRLPRIHLVDLKETPPHPETLLSGPLEEQLRLTLERKEQALFFLNRRGFSLFLLCKDCGEVPRCPNCEISLTYHKRSESLKCHYCEYSVPMMKTCPACQGPNLEPIGSGTERIEENLLKAFPGIKVGRLDRDVAGSRKRTEEVLSQFAQGKIDLLIGTQLVTKGHDFKQLTLVGILLADMTLNLPDFRAAEKVFQIVTQVSGRAGRHDLPGQVYLQTFRPDHYAIVSALSQDPEDFFVHEKTHREQSGYPPYSRIILFRLSGNHDSKVEAACGQLTHSLTRLFVRHNFVTLLGPAKSVLEKIRGKFRWQILLRTQKFEAVRRVLEEKIPHLETQLPPGIQLSIDVDPMGIF
jgi:primosomal protein N' (replication factor Y)